MIPSSVPMSMIEPEREIPEPNMMSNSACLKGGATLFLTTLTRVRMPTMSLPFLSVSTLKDRDDPIGNSVRVKVVKNKVAPPFKQVEFDIMFGEGVSKVGELIDLGVKAGIVEKSGAWFSYDSQRLGQGRENSKQFLRDNPDIANKIETSIRQNAGLLADRILEEATPTPEDLDEGAA